MEKKGKELEFISWIKRDGSGTVPINEAEVIPSDDDDFELICLSLSEKTFIASGFNSFVVKLKEPEKERKVYVVSAYSFDNPFSKVSNEEFIKKAIEQKSAYTYKEFAEACESLDVSVNESFIRIL